MAELTPLPGGKRQPTWKVWDGYNGPGPICEGTEETCRAAVVALAATHPSLILEDPDGREWFLGKPGSQGEGKGAS